MLGIRLSTSPSGLAAISAFPIDADFSTYALGTLNGQNSWAQIGGFSTTNTASPIQVIVADGAVPQSIRITGLASASQSYRDLPTASRFNPTTVTAATFYYVLDNFKVIEALNSTTSTGQGIFALTGTAGGSSPTSARLFLRRFGGVTANTTTFDLGISASGATPVYGTTALAVGTLYKIVVAYTANPGLANDVVKVYVNPVGSDPTTWSHEVTQTATTDPTQSFKSFQITPGAISNSTKTDLTIGRILVGLSDVLAVTPILECSDLDARVWIYGVNGVWNSGPRTLTRVADRHYTFGSEVIIHDGTAWEYYYQHSGESKNLIERVVGNQQWPWLVPWIDFTAQKLCLPPVYPAYDGGATIYTIGDRVSHGGGNYVCIYNAGSVGYGPFGGFLTGAENGIIYWLPE